MQRGRGGGGNNRAYSALATIASVLLVGRERLLVTRTAVFGESCFLEVVDYSLRGCRSINFPFLI